MPFKLIHLACALELPATPSVPHSVCQRSLCAEGVNVNSSSAWTEKSLKDTEREGENEDREKIDGIYGDFFPLIRFVFQFTRQSHHLFCAAD